MKNLFKRGKLLACSGLAAAVLTSGCGNSDNFVFTNTNLGVAPVAQNDAFSALGNATVNFSAANGALVNDSLNGGGISSFDAVGSSGGALVLNSDGSLSYTPVFGFVGAETFNYTLSNQVGASTATITFTSTGSGFFVDNTAPDGGNGSQAQPFDTLAEAVAAASAGDTVFVARGNGTSDGLNGAINLPDGVNLTGEGAGLVVAQTIVAPGLQPLVTGPIFCLGNNTVSGLNIQGSATVGIDVTDAGNVVITNNTIGGHAEESVFLTDTTGTVTITNNLFENPTTDLDFICGENDGVNGNLVINDNTFTNSSNIVLDALAEVTLLGNSVMSVTFSGNMANGTEVDQFHYGLYVEAEETSQATVAVADNMMNNFHDEVIGVHARDGSATLNGTVTGNTISNVGDDDAIHGVVNAGTLTLSGNVVSNASGSCIYVEAYDDGGTLIIENNQLTNGDDDGLFFESYSSGSDDTRLLIRNNTVTDGVPHSIHVYWGALGDLCLELTGNTVNSDIVLEEDSDGDFGVEQFNILDTLNTLNGGSMIDDGTGTFENLADGECSQ